MNAARFATRPEHSRGRLVPEPESRTRNPFQRDRDRIIHSTAFRRLKYKTQVFVYHEGDYYRTRLTHSLEVAQIARSMARFLGLNEDLAEAVSLAHDLGHTPFGHAGENALNAAMAPWGGFHHNDQTLRILTLLEQRYAAFDGLNLAWETIEGVAKHNGPLASHGGATAPTPTLIALDEAWGLELARQPSLEAQLAAIADDIAYDNHDIDDGLRAKLFDFDELAAIPLVGDILDTLRTDHPGLAATRLRHELVRRLINRMVEDVLAETARRLAQLAVPSGKGDAIDAIRDAGQAMVGFSPALQETESGLRDFLFRRMYRHYRVNRETSKARRVVTDLFGLLFAEPNCLPDEWQDAVAAGALEAGAANGTLANPGASAEQAKARVIGDYIAGMTDRYALVEHQRLFGITPRM